MLYLINFVNFSRQSFIFFAFTALTSFFISSCSQKSNSFVAKGFHNTTARFNAYFLCKEKMLEIEKKIRKNHVDDYNQVLHLYPSIDSNYTKGFEDDFKYINERAILIPGKHKNSHWVDDSYILMGRVKMYRMKLDSAEKFFRYVNKSFKDPQGIQASQLYLLQTFMVAGDKDNARIAHELIVKYPAYKKNELLYCKTLAEYYRITEKYSKMIPLLQEAVKYEQRKDERSRLFYILGQLYQQQDDEKNAFDFFVRAQKRNPPYILEFNAKLSALKVSPRENAQDRKRLAKTLKRLKKDPNNKEYLDRIYYEVALYYQKHNQIDSTITNLEKSLLASEGDVLQKGYAYYESAEIYFNEIDYLEESRSAPRSSYYVQSKLYYDSTLLSVDSTFKPFKKIEERQEILERFVKELLIVEKEDSLLVWADMDTTQLAEVIEKLALAEERQMIAQEEARREKVKEDRAMAEAAKQGVTTGGNYDPNLATTFKFYDPISIENSKIAFTKRWGNRLLENNWRRSVKDLEFDDDDEEDIDSTTISTANDSLISQEKEKPQDIEENLDAPYEVHVDRSKYYADIPFTKEQKEIAYSKIEDALYLLGKIYNYELFEKEYAIESLMRHEKHYPISENRAEVLYTLVLLCRNSTTCERETYAKLLHKEFPYSKYTKLIDNPNYVADYEIKNKKARELYAEAFDNYKKGYYSICYQKLDELKSSYPNNDIQDKVQFLSILILAKKDKMYAYKTELTNFIKQHKTSDIIPYAKKLLDKYVLEDYKTPTNSITFTSNMGSSTFYCIAIYDQDSLFSRASSKEFNNEFLKTFFKDQKVDIKQVELNERYFMFTFKNFTTENKAKEFLQKIQNFAAFKKIKSNVTFNVISKENYQVLITTEDVTGYRARFKKRI